jgi:hypothetical protein
MKKLSSKSREFFLKLISHRKFLVGDPKNVCAFRSHGTERTIFLYLHVLFFEFSFSFLLVFLGFLDTTKKLSSKSTEYFLKLISRRKFLAGDPRNVCAFRSRRKCLSGA